MSSRRAKNIKMREKRERWEAEIKERGQDFLKKEQARRNADREKAEQARKDKAIAKSKRLAKQHRQGITEHKPAPKNLPRPQKQEAS